MNLDSSDSPDVARAKRLVDDLKMRGFRFERTAPGADGPLRGQRVTDRWVDTVYIEGFSYGCMAWRQRRSSLIVAGRGLEQGRIAGSALTVLSEALTWKTEP